MLEIGEVKIKEKLIVNIPLTNEEKAYRLVSELKDSSCLFQLDAISALKLKTQELIKLLKKLPQGKIALKVSLGDSLYYLEKSLVELSFLKFNLLSLEYLGNEQSLMEETKRTIRVNGFPYPLLISAIIPDVIEKEKMMRLGLYDGKSLEYLEDEDKNVALKMRLVSHIENLGFHGVVISIKEVNLVKIFNLFTIVPNIIPAFAQYNEVKKIIFPQEAIKLGADFILVNEDITQEPNNWGKPDYMVEEINKQILYASKKIETE